MSWSRRDHPKNTFRVTREKDKDRILKNAKHQNIKKNKKIKVLRRR